MLIMFASATPTLRKLAGYRAGSAGLVPEALLRSASRHMMFGFGFDQFVERFAVYETHLHVVKILAHGRSLLGVVQ